MSSSKSKMASPRPKSPRPINGKNDKEESFWDKIGTLGRKKRIKEGKDPISTSIKPQKPRCITMSLPYKVMLFYQVGVVIF